MNRALIVLLVVLLTGPATAQDAAPPPPRTDRVMIVSIDGARPDVMLRAEMPTIRSLLKGGSFSFWARTTEASITLPSHTSMLTGVPPDKHGITWNADIPADQMRYSPYPTLFELAKEKGLTTAMVAGKSKFIALAKPGSVDWADVPEAGKGYDDLEVARMAADIVRRHQPNVLVVHFGGVDGAGHGVGWGSPAQIAALEKADKGLGQVVDALKERGLYDSTLIIVSSDHGGAGKNHGRNDVRSRHIPWIATGPGVREGFDLTTYTELTINTEDTFATACNFLGITPGPDITGKPILEILTDFELLRSEPTPPTTEPAFLPTTAPTPIGNGQSAIGN